MDLSRLVGNTPLIKLGDRLYAKFETYNPSGSIKDRIGYYILKKAEERGDLKPGDTIVEATSGNAREYRYCSLDVRSKQGIPSHYCDAV